jgi:hypothetical protein
VNIRKQVLLACAGILGISSAGACDVKLQSGRGPETPRMVLDRHTVVSPAGTRHLTFETADCALRIQIEHGPMRYSCGTSFGGLWAASKSDLLKDRFYLSPRAARRLPRHQSARASWLASIDDEGVHNGSYPISEENIIAFYPRQFLKIGPKVKIENPDFEASAQTITYVTMKGEQRAAITGAATVGGCLTFRFVDWSKPAEALTIEKDMIEFLGDLRLEPL